MIKCEWCGMSYPSCMDYDYYRVVLFGKEEHVICADCKDHLRIVYKDEKEE